MRLQWGEGTGLGLPASLLDGLPIADGAIRTACEQSCPADAIVFGNVQDPKSRISQIRKDPRHYRLFDELNLEGAVGYLTLERKA